MKFILPILAAISLACAPLSFVGCQSTPAVASYKTLASVQVTVDKARSAFLDAVNAGRVDNDTMKKALNASLAFNQAFNTALFTLKTTQAPSPESVTAAATAFLTLVAQFIK